LFEFGFVRIGINYSFYYAFTTQLPELVWSNVRKLGVWGKNASNTVNSRLMGSQWVGHGIYKSHCICSGNNGTVVVTANTIACLSERKRERNSVASLSSIMGNGHFTVLMAFRFPCVIFQFNFKIYPCCIFQSPILN
jgi:hypothetical protein